ncbi:MAG: lysylphosphatidylglycerol synthase transmembrane domain-containing protein [Candidatus Methanospirareceae archaeon]
MLERRKVLLLASIAISLTTILFILFLSPYKITRETIDALAKINPYYLGLAIGTQIGTFVIRSARLKLMSDFIGISGEGHGEKGGANDLKLSQSLKITLASLFAACITPSQFGGEPVRIYLLNKNGLSVGDGTAVVLGERLLDFVVIMVGAATSFLLFRAVLPHHSVLYPVFTVIGASLSACVVIMAYTLVRPEEIKRVIDFLYSKIKIKRLEKVEDKFHRELENFYRAAKRFQCEGKDIFWLALLLTIAFWLVAFMVPSLLLLGFGANPVWLHSIAAQFILLIILALPITPGGSGVAEFGITYLYHTLVKAPVLGIFVVIWRLSTYYVSLIVGGITSAKVLSEIS